MIKAASSRKLRIVVSIARAGASGRDFYSGILRYAEQKFNWQIIVPGTRHLEEARRQIIEEARREPMDGLITDFSRNAIVPSDLHLGGKLRYVAVEPTDRRQHPSCCRIDDRQIACAAADLLLRRGFHEFAYVAVEDRDSIAHSTARQHAFVNHLAKAGFKVHTIIFNEDIGRRLRELPKPTGVFIYNDELAREVLDACRLEHLNVPEQLALIGVDNDTAVCENVRPTLSTVQPDFELGGYRAAETLDRLIRGTRRQLQVTYGVKTLIERDSTRSLKQGWRAVNAAMSIIRTRYAERLTTEQIAAEVRLSATSLRERFAEVLGQSVHESLQHTRLEHAERLLTTTHDPVCEIAAACGFPCVENFIRQFRRRCHLTPSQYRG